MESIKYFENKAILKINEKIYSKHIIEKAAKDFSPLCNVNLKGNFIEIIPLGKSIDVKTLSYEFFNYMLALIKE